jgi:hypothetical protein
MEGGLFGQHGRMREVNSGGVSLNGKRDFSQMCADDFAEKRRIIPRTSA